MKKLFVIMLGLGLGLNSYAKPFYKVKCFDSKNRVISCDPMPKKLVRKSVKKETLSQRKARERALALREIARQNAKLKAELESLRQANAIAAAKTEEAPKTAQLAPVTQVTVPTPTVSTQIAKNIEPASDEATWTLEAANEISKSFQADSGLGNEVDLSATYSPSKKMDFTFEEDMIWLWSNPKNVPNNGFTFLDPMFGFKYSGIYTTESKQTSLDGKISFYPGLTSDSRNAGKIGTFVFRLVLTTKFNDGKGYVRFEPEFDPVINKYTTSAPTATAYKDGLVPIGDNYYENLPGNARFIMAMKVAVNYRLMDGVKIETYVKSKSAYTYADEILQNGQTYTLTPAGLNTSVEIAFPRVTVEVNERFSLEGKFVTNSPLASFKPFSTENGNDMGVFFRMTYGINL